MSCALFGDCSVNQIEKWFSKKKRTTNRSGKRLFVEELNVNQKKAWNIFHFKNGINN